eukprot:9467656-Pyramimonas_sp.AAC.1
MKALLTLFASAASRLLSSSIAGANTARATAAATSLPFFSQSAFSASGGLLPLIVAAPRHQLHQRRKAPGLHKSFPEVAILCEGFQRPCGASAELDRLAAPHQLYQRREAPGLHDGLRNAPHLCEITQRPHSVFLGLLRVVVGFAAPHKLHQRRDAPCLCNGFCDAVIVNNLPSDTKQRFRNDPLEVVWALAPPHQLHQRRDASGPHNGPRVPIVAR